MRCRPVLTLLYDLLQLYFEKRVSRSAAAMSYYTFLTLFPLLICLNAMLGHLFPTTARFLDVVGTLLPEHVTQAIAEYLHYIAKNSSRGMLTAGLALMFTSSAAMFRAIHNIMADLHGKPRFRALHSWPLSFLFSLLFLAVMYFAVLVILLGSDLLGVLAEKLRFFNAGGAWNLLRFPMLFFVLLAMLLGLYRITAPQSERRGLVVGAAAATAAIEVLSLLFSVFIGMSAKYALVYGSLASLIVLAIWLYLCCTIVILGNGLNVVLKRREQR